jgi:glycosyltransferase involved in cell wall biosynthesis
MISIIIPACNEEAVIGRCIASILEAAEQGEVEIIVVANGCVDDTIGVARSFGGPVRVMECPQASKPAALNLGDASARGFPRFYLDADIVIGMPSLRAVAAALEAGSALVAASTCATRFLPGTSWSVKAYYAFWRALPYVRDSMIASGVYALGREGRSRFGEFPQLISDDGFIRLQFRAEERVEVTDAESIVTAPTNLTDLVRIRTRSRAGWLELRRQFPEAFRDEARSKNYIRAMAGTMARPRLFVAGLIYAWVFLVSRLRARKAIGGPRGYRWERDLSSRVGA